MSFDTNNGTISSDHATVSGLVKKVLGLLALLIALILLKRITILDLKPLHKKEVPRWFQADT